LCEQGQFALFAEAVLSYEPGVQGLPTWPVAWVDGTRTPVSKPKTERLKALFYSGYKKMYCFNNVFIFAPNGKCIWNAIAFPGTRCT